MAKQWAKKINPGKALPDRATPAEIRRFLKPVVQRQVLPMNHAVQGDCWVRLKRHKDPRGYGQFKWRGRAVWDHRFSHEVFIGPVPDGDDVDHLCLNPSCVNPAHLAAKSAAKNRGYKRELAAADPDASSYEFEECPI